MKKTPTIHEAIRGIIPGDNFYGRYEFTKSFQPIDINAIVQELVSRSGSTPPAG